MLSTLLCMPCGRVHAADLLWLQAYSPRRYVCCLLNTMTTPPADTHTKQNVWLVAGWWLQRGSTKGRQRSGRLCMPCMMQLARCDVHCYIMRDFMVSSKICAVAVRADAVTNSPTKMPCSLREWGTPGCRISSLQGKRGQHRRQHQYQLWCEGHSCRDKQQDHDCLRLRRCWQ
jgi:hypothetical protein